MARRRGLMASIARMQREAARAEAARLRAQAEAQRAALRARAEYERAIAASERERKRLYAESRAAQVAAMNDELAARRAALDGVLAATLDVDDYFDLNQLKQPVDVSRLLQPEPPPVEAAFMPEPPRGITRLLGGGSKYEEQVRAARWRYEQAPAQHAERERQRLAQLKAAEEENRRRDQEVQALHRDLAAGEPQAVVTYLDLVFNASPFPDGFPQHWRLAYVPDSHQLVVEYDLPTLDVVPKVKAYRYVKSSDTITETARPAAEVKEQYASVIAQTTLRVIHEVFEADRLGHVETVVFNGLVTTVDPATGKQIRPCLVSVRTTRSAFAELDLSRVDPVVCLQNLGAGVSRNPTELAPVRPVLEFGMVDPRFIEETDVLSGLDDRPNLMEMTPTEFEGLIQNLFSRMGLDTRQTRPSRDGGVDCVAFDPRPIMGGKVVIQAKRYKHTVGVSAVRDLYGTLQNEGASKGILVTTSGYGRASFDFAKNKPIELLDGANLLYLLKEHAGIEARIEAPQGWRDPVADAPPVPDEGRAAPRFEPLRAGQNAGIGGDELSVQVGWRKCELDLDVSALLLGPDGKVRSDADFVFYNQEVSADGAVVHGGKSDDGSVVSDSLELDLGRIDPAVAKVVIAVSVDGGVFGQVADLVVTASVSGGRGFRFTPTATVDTALICAEVYRRNGAWRIRAVGQGYRDGLAGLARDFGVDVE